MRSDRSQANLLVVLLLVALHKRERAECIYPGPTTKATSRSRVWSATSRLASRKGTRADSANSAASRAQESLLLSRCEVQ